MAFRPYKFELQNKNRPLSVARQESGIGKYPPTVYHKFCEKERCFMNFSKINDDIVVGLCWNCGKEIRLHDKKYFVNDEVWCERCADNGIRVYVDGRRDE